MIMYLFIINVNNCQLKFDFCFSYTQQIHPFILASSLDRWVAVRL
jgi:hypothetical protein